MNDSDGYSRKREAMVEKQLIGRGIKDERVITTMRKVKRHLFVDEVFRDKAYNDSPLPIGEKQTISQPYMVAFMSEILGLNGNEKVLEIGTGSGYQTAVLSQLARQVYSVERIPSLLIKTRKLLESLEYHNIALKIADGTLGWKDGAPYNAIMVTAGGPEMPRGMVDQLAVGGRLIIPIGNEEKQTLRKLVKTRSGVRETVHLNCTFVKLVGIYGWREAPA